MYLQLRGRHPCISGHAISFTRNGFRTSANVYSSFFILSAIVHLSVGLVELLEIFCLFLIPRMSFAAIGIVRQRGPRHVDTTAPVNFNFYFFYCNIFTIPVPCFLFNTSKISRNESRAKFFSLSHLTSHVKK